MGLGLRNTRMPLTGSLRESSTTSTRCSSVLKASSFLTSGSATPGGAGWSSRCAAGQIAAGSRSKSWFSSSKSNRAREEMATTSLSCRETGMVFQPGNG
jgi:hypothetical protein